MIRERLSMYEIINIQKQTTQNIVAIIKQASFLTLALFLRTKRFRAEKA